MPFVTVFQGVLVYDLSSRYVAPFTVLLCIFLGTIFFDEDGWAEDVNIVFLFGKIIVFFCFT